MATINSKTIIDEIIANNGHYYDDPLVVKIVQYNNQFDGGIAYGVIYAGEPLDKYHIAPACHNPITIFERKC